jgi:hypothetical protein
MDEISAQSVIPTSIPYYVFIPEEMKPWILPILKVCKYNIAEVNRIRNSGSFYYDYWCYNRFVSNNWDNEYFWNFISDVSCHICIREGLQLSPFKDIWQRLAPYVRLFMHCYNAYYHVDEPVLNIQYKDMKPVQERVEVFVSYYNTWKREIIDRYGDRDIPTLHPCVVNQQRR